MGDMAKLLLLGGDESWRRSLAIEAEGLGITGVETTESVQEALGRLASDAAGFSHVLVQPGAAGGLLPDLVRLTAGEAECGTALVMLGESGHPVPDRVEHVAAPHPGWLRATLLRRARLLALPPPPVARPDAAFDATQISNRYQPIVNLDDRAVVGVEALARLEHPVLGTLPPGLFVPQFEETGHALNLATAVLRGAFADWRAAGLGALPTMRLGFNLPPEVVLRPDLPAQLGRLCEECGIAAERIVVEITETRPVSDLPAMGRAIAALRESGYRIAVDDVAPDLPDHLGLLTLPIHTVKLDQGVVRRAAAGCARARFFIAELVALTRDRGLDLVAEGVESPASWALMAALGVDKAQGFLIGRPLPAAVVPMWYRAWTQG